MIKAGKPVDDTIEKLIPYLSKGDILIDGGNSFFRDTIRRSKKRENYSTSYANPHYAVNVLGEGVGQLLCKNKGGISYAFKSRLFSLEENN